MCDAFVTINNKKKKGEQTSKYNSFILKTIIMSMASPLYPPNSGTNSPLHPGLYEYLAELVSKRVATIKYIRKAHEGNTHWFNTILLTRENLTEMYPNSKMVKR